MKISTKVQPVNKSYYKSCQILLDAIQISTTKSVWIKMQFAFGFIECTYYETQSVNICICMCVWQRLFLTQAAILLLPLLFLLQIQAICLQCISFTFEGRRKNGRNLIHKQMHWYSHFIDSENTPKHRDPNLLNWKLIFNAFRLILAMRIGWDWII